MTESEARGPGPRSIWHWQSGRTDPRRAPRHDSCDDPSRRRCSDHGGTRHCGASLLALGPRSPRPGSAGSPCASIPPRLRDACAGVRQSDDPLRSCARASCSGRRRGPVRRRAPAGRPCRRIAITPRLCGLCRGRSIRARLRHMLDADHGCAHPGLMNARRFLPQNESFALLSAAKVVTALPPPQRDCIRGSSARRKGLVASSRSSLVGTVGTLLARRRAISST